MHRNKSVNVHQFAMVPRAEIPRSQFNRESTHKTTINASYLIPIYVDEVLPGDTFNLRATMFARMATPIFPIMDNLYLDSFFFFVPNRLIWEHWPNFMGERDNPDDTTVYEIPEITSPAGGYDVGSIFDYFGLPTKGQVGAQATVTHSCLPLRAYNLIYNEWFRDQNIVDKIAFGKGDGPDSVGSYGLQQRGKRHDYFTSCLPWTQKGSSVPLPISGTAPVIGDTGTDMIPLWSYSGTTDHYFVTQAAGGNLITDTAPGTDTQPAWHDPKLVADLSQATMATINQLRQAFQIQKLLERDARGGSRYTEIVRAHFGVVSPDARLQRPEYLGGGTSMVNINPVAQTSQTATTPLGQLAAFGTALASGHGFSASFTEHGYVIGLVSVRADLTYQQGLRRMWNRSTRYDFYFPAFAALGEQAVLNKEIYCTGSADDEKVFGYQERWAEMRYMPSQISGQFKSSYTAPLDGWHLAQYFTQLPELESAFIKENVPMERVLAVGQEADGQHFLLDCFFENKVARPMPMYSVPGLIDHF